MPRIAAEMEREGFEIPLLIGGATTSKIHTAVKIDQRYHGSTVHVLDASRAVGVAAQLLSDDKREAFVADINTEYDDVRTRFQRRFETRREGLCKTSILAESNDVIHAMPAGHT